MSTEEQRGQSHLVRGHVVGLMRGIQFSIKPPRSVKFLEDYRTLPKDMKIE